MAGGAGKNGPGLMAPMPMQPWHASFYGNPSLPGLLAPDGLPGWQAQLNRPPALPQATAQSPAPAPARRTPDPLQGLWDAINYGSSAV